MLLFLLGQYLGMWLLVHTRSVCFTLQKIAKVFSKVVVQFYIPTNNVGEVYLLYFFQLLLVPNYIFIFIIYLSLFVYWPHLTACGILVPRPGIKPMPPAVLTTGPPGKSLFIFLNLFIYFLKRNSRSFIYLFMTVLSLRFCARAFSSCGKWGSLFIAVHGPLTIAASLVAEHRLQTRRLSNCGSRAQLLHSMWDLPRPGLEPVSPALAGRFSTTAPPGKP